MPFLRRSAVALLAASCLPGPAALAQTFDERFDDWPVDHRIRGTVAVATSLAAPATIAAARLARGSSARIALLAEAEIPDERLAAYRASFPDLSVTRYDDLAQVDLEERLSGATLLCWETTRELSGAEREHLSEARAALAGHVDAGRALVAIGPGARWFGAHVPADVVHAGLGLLPDVAIADTLEPVFARHPRAVGVTLEGDALLVLRHRLCAVHGSGGATFRLHAAEDDAPITRTIRQPTERRPRPSTFLVDLTQWRRMAIDATLEPFPAAEPRPPVVENGTLLIVGGGGLPDGLMDRFIELAGGAEDARLVYIPCSERERVGPTHRMVEDWERRGVRHATFLHTKDRRRANGDDAFLAPLEDATGLWFGGGRQWNFADSYYGTKAHRMMKEVLARGGVIGGSSAGASIQGRFLARATPIENVEILAPGYERGGLGFLDGVAIDQHFSQRGRQKDMTQLVERYPQLLGIGIDETTALEVRGRVARVLGAGRVFFYDRREPPVPGRPDHLALGSGALFDLVAREVTRSR